ncbi:MAG TPA: amino acid permease [Steroidobacteraceae bacterium]|nr:amino acid permease [Steroidobacteraceae bacterium]
MQPSAPRSPSAGSPTLARPELTRGLGLLAAISVNVANIIGTGIFLKTRVMTCNVGDAETVLLVWLAAGLLTLAGTLSYAEIASLHPEAGGEYVFLRRAYGRFTGFLYGWTFFTVARCGSQAALAVGFAIFMNVAFGGALESLNVKVDLLGTSWQIGSLTIVALGAIWLITIMNCISLTLGGNTAVILTLIKLLMLLAVGSAALVFGQGDWSHLHMSATGGSCEGVAAGAMGGIAGFGAAMLGALWAYDGWNNVTAMCGEIRDPSHNIPRAFFSGTLIVILLYLLANLGYFYVLTPAQVASVSPNSSVGTEVLKTFMGSGAVTLMAVALAISTIGALHASVLANARIPFAMARDGLFFRRLAELSPRSHLPVNALLVQAVWASVLALSGTFDTLTDAVIFASWLFYGLTTATVFVFRRTMPDAERPYRVWGYPFLPLLFLVATAAMLASALIAAPRQALNGLVTMAIGVPFYLYWARRASA